ncbi:MAG: sugar phosphate isomerase/epimerase [Candidatus Korarchaeota archaeon]|nr:sugar phosphate isomerase/epimerase [Candidatus Korarchaeota archaeon]
MSDYTFGGMNNPYEELKSEVTAILNYGMDFVELTVEWPNSWIDNIRENLNWLMDVVDSYDTFYLIHSPWYLEIGHPYDEVRRGALKEGFKVIDIASKLEAPYVTFHPFTPGWLAILRDKAKELNVEGFRELVKYSKDKGVQVLIENIDHGAFRSPSDIRYIMDRVPDLFMTLDIAHTFLNGGMEKFRSYLTKFGGEILHLHAHDNDLNRDLHLPIGAGKIPWKDVAVELVSHNYRGTITLEPHVSDLDYLAISKEKLLLALNAAKKDANSKSNQYRD